MLLTDHADYGRRRWWPLADFPATEHVLATAMPGQVVAGDPAGDPPSSPSSRTPRLRRRADGPGARRPAASSPCSRSTAALPQAFTGAEVDRARVVAQQFGAALARLTTT